MSAAVPHGQANWPEVTGCISCSYTCSHGITAGVASLMIPVQDLDKVPLTGTLTITDKFFGTITLPRSRIDRVSVSMAGSGKGYLLTILDRRWEWRHGAIDGWYNQPDYDPGRAPEGEFVIRPGDGPFLPFTKKPLKELVELCLKAMGEVGYEIGDLPETYPAVNWYHQNPAQILAQLVDSVGFRVVYQPHKDRVLIAKLGETAGVPKLPLIEEQPTVNPPDPPNTIEVVGGLTWYCDYLPLEAVGMEEDGRIRAIDNLSYMPEAGWEFVDPGDNGINMYSAETYAQGTVARQRGIQRGDSRDFEVSLHLARSYVWRLYRINLTSEKDPDNPRPRKKNEKLELKELGLIVEDPYQIVLGQQIIEAEKDAMGRNKTRPAKVRGLFYKGIQPVYTIKFIERNFTEPTEVELPFTIDPERSLVMFSKMVYRLVKTLDEWQAKQPVLKIYTSFHYRDKDTRQMHAMTNTRHIGNTGGKQREVVRRPEIITIRTIKRNALDDYRFIEEVNNIEDVRAASDYYIDAALKKYETALTSTNRYAGIHAVMPDGGIHQVSWSVGSGPATTTVSLNSEHAVWLPSYPERRTNEHRTQLFDLGAGKPPEW